MTRMKIFLFCAAIALCRVYVVCGGQCDAETLSASDERFCHGELEVIYPELKISTCDVIPPELRDKLRLEWGAPRVQFAYADEGKKYTLLMVDPDAPSHCNPKSAHWRHWLVADIAGSDLKKGDFKGLVLSEYAPPSPPKKVGLHRYQFMLYAQPADKTLSLSETESSSRGKWDPDAFIRRFGLGRAVAAVQYLTQTDNLMR